MKSIILFAVGRKAEDLLPSTPVEADRRRPTEKYESDLLAESWGIPGGGPIAVARSEYVGAADCDRCGPPGPFAYARDS